MKSQFERLCRELNFNPDDPSEEALLALNHWYVEQVSRYTSDRDVITSARHYLEVFLPNLPTDRADSVPAFNHMNAVQYAASKGYDRFLAQLSPSEKMVCNLAIERNGMTPLHLAASYGHTHTVNVLLQQGADPNQKNIMGQYPIYSALFTPMIADDAFRQRKIDIFNALKSAAPNTVSDEDDSGVAIANLAVMHGYESIVSDLIRNHRLSLFKADNFMKYPIHYAVTNNQVGVISILMKEHGTAQLVDSEGRCALHYAAQATGSAVLEACLPFYEDINIRDLKHKTPLHYAVEAGNLAGFQVLVKDKADIHATDFSNRGILHYAVLSNNIEIVRWILNNLPLEINMLDIAGETALDYSTQRELVYINSLLIEHGAVKNNPSMSQH